MLLALPVAALMSSADAVRAPGRVSMVDPAEVLAGPVLAGLSLARIPLFFSPALIAPLLPRLVALHKAGDHRQVARTTGVMLAAMGASALDGVLLALPLGEPLTRLVFGSQLRLPGDQVAILVGGAMVFLAGQFATSVLVAVEQHGWVALGWGAGLATYGLPRASTADPVLATEWGLVLGASVSAAVFVGALIATRPHEDRAVPG